MLGNIALFLHLLGVVTLFIAMGILQRSGHGARRATTTDEARQWLGFAGSSLPMFAPATLTILVTGLFMGWQTWGLRSQWLDIAIAAVVIMAVTGPLGVGRGLHAMIKSASGAPAGPIPPELASAIRQPEPWAIAGALNGMAIGILWVMVSKPGWFHAIVAIGGAAAVGAFITRMMVRSGK